MHDYGQGLMIRGKLPRRKLPRRSFLFLLFLITAFVFITTACNNETLWTKQKETNSRFVQTEQSNLAHKPIATKTINHALGQVEIPLNPQRIVVLDPNSEFLLDALVSLGVKPVGLTRCSNCINSDPFSEFLGELPTVGNHEQPSLEKILSLKPDLILGYKWQKSFYPLLSQIAPTVLVETVYSGINDFERNFKYLAEILDRSDRAAMILATYNEKIQKFRKRFGEKLKTKTVSVLHYFDSTVHVYRPEILSYVQVMKDAGVQFTPAYENLKSDYLGLSLETISDWDADFLFVEVYDEEDENHKSLFKEPIWSTLKAVQNGHVYIMTVHGGGPIMASQLIDDLQKFFSDKL